MVVEVVDEEGIRVLARGAKVVALTAVAAVAAVVVVVVMAMATNRLPS